MADSDVYEKCAHCHLFIERNEDPGPGWADYFHMHRGDEDDEALDAAHEAEPSGQKHTLAWWKANGPLEMRARFDPELYHQTVRMQESGMYDNYPTTALVEFITDGHRDTPTTRFRAELEDWLQMWVQTVHGKIIMTAYLDRVMPTV